MNGKLSLFRGWLSLASIFAQGQGQLWPCGNVVGCRWSLYQLAGQYMIQGALCLDSVVASSSGPDIGHGEAPASASTVKVNVAADRMQIYALLSEFVILLLDISNRE